MLSPTTTTIPTITPTADSIKEEIISLMSPPCGNLSQPVLLPNEVCEAGAENCTLVTSSPGATVVSPVLLCLTGITGHIWALCYLYSGPRRHSTHTVFYLLLCTLIWTDFWGKLITTPPAIISYAFGRWMGGKHMCLFHGFTMIMVQQITHLTVAGMAVERLLAICHCYLYERAVTFTRCWYFLACIWVSSLLVCLLPLFGLGQLNLQYPFTWCYVNIHLCSNTPLRHRFFTTALGSINIGCLVTVVACNVCVVGSLLRMRLSRQIPAHLSSARRPSVHNDQELQMVVLLVVITISFIVSWAPLNIILVSNRFWPPHITKEDHMQDLVAIRLASISQILDPWVYIICRVLFKSRIWRCWRHVIVGRRFSRQKSSIKIKTPADDFLSDAKSTTADPPAEPPADDAGTTLPTLPNPILPLPEPATLLTSSMAGLAGEETMPLSRSVSLAIPIPLFICEHYKLKEDDVMLSCKNLYRAKSCCLDHHHHHYLPLPLPSLPGVLRSHSWDCKMQGRCHFKTSSTQTIQPTPTPTPTEGHAHTLTPTPTHHPATTITTTPQE